MGHQGCPEKRVVPAPRGFFYRRARIDLEWDIIDTVPGLADPANVPPTIAAACAKDTGLYARLATDLSLEDLYDLLEIIQVTNYNRWQADKYNAAQNQ